jgi:ABC-type branched-subunit amino acid transport system substrate-binding protein
VQIKSLALMKRTLLAPALVGFGLSAHGQTSVKIGHAGPLTGPITHIGKDGENGARLAMRRIYRYFGGLPITRG